MGRRAAAAAAASSKAAAQGGCSGGGGGSRAAAAAAAAVEGHCRRVCVRCQPTAAWVERQPAAVAADLLRLWTAAPVPSKPPAALTGSLPARALHLLPQPPPEAAGCGPVEGYAGARWVSNCVQTSLPDCVGCARGSRKAEPRLCGGGRALASAPAPSAGPHPRPPCPLPLPAPPSAQAAPSSCWSTACTPTPCACTPPSHCWTYWTACPLCARA